MPQRLCEYAISSVVVNRDTGHRTERSGASRHPDSSQCRMGPDPVRCQRHHLRAARRATSSARHRLCARGERGRAPRAGLVRGVCCRYHLRPCGAAFYLGLDVVAIHIVSGRIEGPTPYIPGWRLIAATSLAGVRGTITLAGVLTLSLTMNDGSAFPARDLAIFLAARVIIVSLLAASLSLPYLLKNLELPPEPSQQEEEDLARIAAAETAIQAVEQAQHDIGEGRNDADLYTDAGVRIMELYRQRIDGRSKTGKEAVLARKIDEIERKRRLTGLRAERAEFYRMARARQLSDETARKLVREVDLLESRFGAR
jgi:hypothetical protein